MASASSAAFLALASLWIFFSFVLAAAMQHSTSYHMGTVNRPSAPLRHALGYITS